MPPVRWKYHSGFFTVTAALCLLQVMTNTDAQQLQDVISMTSDGWRPIVGTRSRQPPQYHHPEEITHYRNPSHKSETMKADVPSTSPPAIPTKPYKKPIVKLPPQQGKVYFGTHGPHIPIGAGAVTLNRPSGVQLKKHSFNSKPQHHISINGKRILKPVRMQSGAHSTRDEVFVPPPPNSGSYSFISQGQSNVKTRETQGLGLLGTNHFTINHQQPDFNSRFALPTSENVYQQFNSPVQSFLFTKPPHTNEVHYPFKTHSDDYTRNLVPPPPYKLFQDNKEQPKKQKIKLNKDAVVPVTEEQQFIKQTVIPQNVLLQVPPQFEQNFAFTPKDKTKEQAVEVHVTKEKLKVFHNNIPTNYNPHLPEYVDYDYHTVRTPADLPRIQTYEVTEGKQPWQDQQPPVYNFQRPSVEPHRFRHPQVELNLPPFLPTPYKPEGVLPTSPTQNEVSTIFSHLSTKMNHRKHHEFSTLNPLYFDVKEVSTHYPILGRPQINPELSTEKPEELSNEITTSFMNNPVVKEEIDEVTTKEPARTRLTHRRRRPTNRPRTTTSTTETPTESIVQEEVETERPQRRRPSRYRTSTQSSNSDENSEYGSRSRSRYRQRGSNYRKRTRPTDLPVNHKMTKADSVEEYPTTEMVRTTTERETQGLFETGFNQDSSSSSSEEETHIKYEQPVRHYETQQEQDESDGRYETTALNNVVNVQKPFEENSDETTEKMREGSITEQLPTTNLHLPENEVDFSTARPNDDESTEEVKQEVATLATTTTTTTTTVEPTTTKSHRIRGRPVKYDVSNRPRFSVKEYRQRFNQYSSTSTTTEPSVRSPSDNLRLRYPSRLRTRPTTTTTTSSVVEDEVEPARSRFRPKEPRHGATTETPNETIIPEKNVKSVNPRLRPFGRYRTTTEASSTTPRVSIKPNLFSQRRRPPQLSLRTRIQNKLNKNSTVVEEKTTIAPSESETTEMTTVVSTDETPEEEGEENVGVVQESTTSADILRNEAVLHSQRVSDLTSSFKNDYNMFKSVSPTSRRIPNYFTISTEDPILPIEAFFPNIKEKDKE